MASRRAPIRKGSVNYGNFSSNDFGSQTKKGTKPTAPRATVMDVLIEMAVDIGKMYLMLKIQYRIAVYLGVLFGVSIIGDVLPYPKSYFSQSSHFLNQYFVKLGWGWTLISTIPFVVMTSYTYCCSDRKQVGFHLLRLGVATFFWLFWTNMFQYVEGIYGRCGDAKFTRRAKCLDAGSRWSGFDISGHSFLLIYSVLIMIEESKPIQGWPRIQIDLDSEKHARSLNEKSEKRFFQHLSLDEIKRTEKNFTSYRRYVCFNFIGVCVLSLIWDLMILTTAMYYHTMLEKFVSGLIAIFTWYVTYRVWFKVVGFPPVPGAGSFKYYEPKEGSSLGVSASTSGTSPLTTNGVRKGKK
uniref:FIT family protein CG10671 n=1 Tax=Cacopsylla melanoneura TaxID=428564 RepID=A0A8D8YND6_9HEMI